MVAAHLVQVHRQVFDRQLSQIIQIGLLGEHETAGDAKDVREGLEAAIGTGLEEQESRKVALFTRQVLDEMEAQTGVEPQGQEAGVGGPSHIGRVCTCAFGDVVAVFLVRLVILGEALLEPLDPTWVQQVQAQIVELELGIGSELQEEGQPEIAGCFTRDIDAVEGIVVQGVEQELLGPGIAQVGVVKSNV